MSKISEMMPKGIYAVGNSGIHVDPADLADRAKKWFNSLDDKKKRDQVATVATLGVALCLGVLAYMALKD